MLKDHISLQVFNVFPLGSDTLFTKSFIPLSDAEMPENPEELLPGYKGLFITNFFNVGDTNTQNYIASKLSNANKINLCSLLKEKRRKNRATKTLVKQ